MALESTAYRPVPDASRTVPAALRPRQGDVVMLREGTPGSRRYLLCQYPDSPQMTCPSRLHALQLAAEFLERHTGRLWEMRDGRYTLVDGPEPPVGRR